MREAEVAIFITRRGRSEVLLVHRSRSLGSYWHTIAGGVEAGETPAEAAVRELREETGLEGVVLLPAGATVEYAYELSEEPADRQQRFAPGVASVRVDCFLVEAADAWEPTLDWEHDGHRWCAPADAVATLHWPATADALRRLLGKSVG
jgi:8-oxo-dGTP pyrophosphatase MutT (NUDIX family)